MLHLLTSVGLLAGLAAAPNDSTELRREKLMEELRKGGYTVLLRHARTDRSFNEQRDPVPTARKDQRNLTDDGIKDAALIGVVFRKYGVAFSEVLSSPMYRNLETAEYSVGKPTVVTMALRVFPSTPEQAALVARAPKRGTNRLIVTHHFVIETHVPGIKPGDIAESEAAVVSHLADGTVKLVGRITLGDWQMLANPGESRPSSAVRSSGGAGHGGGTRAAVGVVNHGTPNDTTRTVELPDSHAGHVAREYIAAFNSGDAEKMKAYLESWMMPNPARTMEERLATYTALFADHGPLTVTSIETSQILEVTLGMRSKRGNFRLTVKTSESQPMRAQSVTFTAMEHR